MDNFILSSLINYIPHAIFWKDKNYVFRGCNLEFAKQFGYDSPERIIGKTDYDFPFTKEMIDIYHQDDKQVLEYGLPKINYEETQIQPNGIEKVVLVSKVPFFNEKNEIIGILGIYTDITQKKEEEKQLKIAKDSAELANRAKDEFIANMSHDIRTPLSGIIGISALLEKEVEKPEEKEHAHLINVSGEQLLALLNSVLDIVSTNEKEDDVKHHIVDIYQLIKKIADLELPAIKLKNLNLLVDIDPNVPAGLATDEVKLYRILLNLVGNAIKFTKIGAITIHVHYQQATELLCIEVEDTGPGISEENQTKVFERFYRGDPSYKGLYTGFGVGLHIVQQYINLLEGKIELESELGKGTIFRIIIPAQARNLAKPEQSTIQLDLVTSPPLPQRKDCRSPYILIVEDNAIALKIAEAIVRQANCCYMTATNGEDALDLVQKHQFDLILTDIGLPGISGNELASAIRQQEQDLSRPSTPIVGLTALASQMAEKKSIAAGMNKVITKPINLALLEELLTQLIPTTLEKKEAQNTSARELDKYPLFDIQAGTEVLGHIDVLKEMTEFLVQESLPQDLAELAKDYEPKNWQNIKETAHKMKSSAVYCGAVRLKFACQFLEQCDVNNHQDREHFYQQLLQVIEETKTALIDWQQSLSHETKANNASS